MLQAWDADEIGELSPILPGLRPRAGVATRAVADERYRIHRAVRGLLEFPPHASAAEAAEIAADLQAAFSRSLEGCRSASSRSSP